MDYRGLWSHRCNDLPPLWTKMTMLVYKGVDVKVRLRTKMHLYNNRFFSSTEPLTPFIFANLPTEIILIIFAYAARPTFCQNEDYESTNPYSSALALCRVSKLVRRAVLPVLLRTVLLTEDCNVSAFVHALRIQKAYAQQG